MALVALAGCGFSFDETGWVCLLDELDYGWPGVNDCELTWKCGGQGELHLERAPSERYLDLRCDGFSCQCLVDSAELLERDDESFCSTLFAASVAETWERVAAFCPWPEEISDPRLVD